MSIDRPALLGGPPEFEVPLLVGRPNVVDPEAFRSAMAGVFDRGWLTNNGPLVRELERRLADRLGVDHVVAVANGTAAIEVMVRSAGLSGEVIVPAFTFAATAHALAWLGLTPVLCDVDRSNYGLDPRRVEELVTPQTSAILGVHVFGRPCDVDGLADVAERHGLALMFDAAHALLCTHRGLPVGSFGQAETFSFHATKFFNTFEGGAIATNDEAFAARCRRMRSFGMDETGMVAGLGTNAKMSEAAAAFGLTNLEGIDVIVERNRANFARYIEVLAGSAVRVIDFDGEERQNYQYVSVEVDPEACGLTADELQSALAAEGVMARRYFAPGLHRLEPYASQGGHVKGPLPVTDMLSERMLVLPNGLAVEPRQAESVGRLVLSALEQSADIRRKLAT